MLNSVTSSFIARLRANDEAAWFELWENFGPVIRAQLTKWGRGRIGVETVRDLSQDEFEIRDNGKVQPITLFDRDIQPITAVLLLDGSASMLTLLDEQIQAATEFILRLLPGDKLRIGSFAEDVRMMPDYTSDRDELLAFLENEFNIRLGRRTRLWDAMDEAIVALGKADGRDGC